MNWKEFFKPTIGKIIGIILTLILIFFFQGIMSLDGYSMGLPFTFSSSSKNVSS